ncbi:hypothetical protein NITUZ_40408 [Candidatus Nitrosotenuis uzonensis]|uniref:Uncharacterized protein n=1 Tax=Candidatus Nitrosotenuis uzonensis TaxID=1407055 RepID=V6AUN7_9ARCH|nr:hypothetical protein NITUZ_40408 [Candidatus Nitrosotenuis uzonensis]
MSWEEQGQHECLKDAKSLHFFNLIYSIEFQIIEMIDDMKICVST